MIPRPIDTELLPGAATWCGRTGTVNAAASGGEW
jgi:hypothetical protein